MTQRHGARVSLLFDGQKVIYVAQTVKSGPAQNAPYVIELREDGRNRERFVNWDDDAALVQAIRDALNGEL
ncbi:MAG: hypothetical protein F4Y96_08315 [Chloroflexi bacterium]|nr:hypothetical protein [Chloroflexota bacterium]